MTVQFCTSTIGFNSTLVFSNMNFTFAQPISPACWNWFIAWSQLPLNTRLDIRRKVEADLQSQFEIALMILWAADPNNEFAPCPTNGDPCELASHAVHAKYYQPSCTKTCKVFAKDCDKWEGFLCIKDIPCSSGGCCKKETTYCVNAVTNQVEVCHQAFYLFGECTTPIPTSSCLIELAPCSTVPNCPKG